MRFVVQTFLKLQRLEVFLAVTLPFFLILESALANGVVYNGGPLDIHDPRSWVAFGRGLFFEVLTYASAKLTKLLWAKGSRKGAIVTAVLACWCMLVSAGNNLGWVMSGGEFEGVFASIGHVMPSFVMFFYQAGLGLLLPLSVGCLALVDISHLVHEALESSHLDNRALEVAESEMHRTIYLGAQKKQKQAVQARYDAIAERRADSYVSRVERGDISFGVSSRKALNPGIRRELPPGPMPTAPHNAQTVILPAGPPVQQPGKQPGLLQQLWGNQPGN